MTPSTPGVGLEAIRAELSRRRSAALEAQTVTTTVNLVVFVDDNDHRAWTMERAERIAEKHRARLILLDASGSTEGAIVDDERVEMSVLDIDAEHLASIVNALTVTNVPDVLWWSANRILESSRFRRLVGDMSAAVVDSSGNTTDDTTIKELATFFARYPGRALRDLAWMRLAPWRDVAAQFFDDPHLREELFSLRRVEVTSGSVAEALYLAGWLGSRLGWTACGHDLFCDRNNVQIPLVHTLSGEKRRVSSVRLHTVASIYTAELASENVVSLRIEGEHAREARMHPLQAIDNASLVERAILEPSTDEIFETALRMVGQLLG